MKQFSSNVLKRDEMRQISGGLIGLSFVIEYGSGEGPCKDSPTSDCKTNGASCGGDRVCHGTFGNYQKYCARSSCQQDGREVSYLHCSC